MLVRFSRQSSVPGRCHHPDAALTFCHAATWTEGQKVRVSIVAPLVHIRLPRAAADHVRHVRDRRASICISLLIRWSDGAHVAVTAAFLEGQSEDGHKSSSGSHPPTFTANDKSKAQDTPVPAPPGVFLPDRRIWMRVASFWALSKSGGRITYLSSAHIVYIIRPWLSTSQSSRRHAAAMSDSTSAARLGALAVSTSGGAPSARTKTSSSMRMPIPLHQSGSSGSLVGK